MTTTKSFNLSVENIAVRTFVVPKILVFGANESCRNFKNAQGLCVLGHRFVSCLVIGYTTGRASTALARYHLPTKSEHFRFSQGW